MPLPNKTLQYDQLILKSAGESVHISGHDFFKVEFIDTDGEVKKGFYKPLSFSYPYPAILVPCSLASIVFMGMVTDRVAEKRLVLNERDNIIGTVSIAIPDFKPQAWFNREKIAQEYHQVWRDSSIFLINDILSDAKRLSIEIIDELRITPVTISQTDNIKLTKTFQFLEEDDFDIKSIAIDCDKNNSILLGLKDLIQFRAALKDAASNYYKLEKDKLTTEKNQEFCQLVLTAIKNHETNMHTHFLGTQWFEKFSELISKSMKFYGRCNFQRHLSAPVKDLSDLVRQFPEKIDLFIQYIVNNPKEFEQMITDELDILALANQSLTGAQILIRYIVNNPNEFTRVIKNTNFFPHLAKAFPTMTGVFRQKNVKDALKAIPLIKQSYTIGATRGLFFASHHLPEVPYDISKYMVSFFNHKSGHHLALTCKRAYEAANEERNKTFNELPNASNINYS
ncbi:hypothetical protein [Legionella gresilensis]|uniref:hypothetical protein n=1 Tax=Legionella gresilensis TaxID=91823 RepID=UPI00104195C2|nr:hypothetical protein [Legionella gresilensis]